jgi:hypothetical protein
VLLHAIDPTKPSASAAIEFDGSCSDLAGIHNEGDLPVPSDVTSALDGK